MNQRKSCDDDYEDLFKSQTVNKPLKVTHTPTGDIIDFYLPWIIEGADEYIDFFRAVLNATDRDKVVIHINCVGGNVPTAYNIIDVLKSTAADVEMVIEGPCASAATMIMLAGRHWRVTEHAYAMIHVWSGGYYGKWSDVKIEFAFDSTYSENAFRDTYKGFLTAEEIEDCIKGKDFYFTSKELIERLNSFSEKDAKREELIQNIAQKHQIAVNKEVEAALKQFDRDTASEEKAKAKKSKTTEKKRR